MIMRTKWMTVLFLICAGIFSTGNAWAQNFDELWKKVDEASKLNLPQTVLKLTEEIFRKGEKEKELPQMLKAAVWRMSYRQGLTLDSLYADVNKLEQWLKQSEQPMEKAILHSLLAETYAEFAANNRWTLRQRTEVAGELPEDMRVWTAGQFVEKVRLHACAAVKDSVLLLNTSSGNYKPLVVQGNASGYYHHDMYHLLAMRGITALRQVEELDKSRRVTKEIETLYECMISAYKEKGNDEGVLLSKLPFLEWKYGPQSGYRPVTLAAVGGSNVREDVYAYELDRLKTAYREKEVCAEVYLDEAEYLMSRQQQAAALRICEEAINLYPDYFRIGLLKNLRENILTPVLEVNIARSAYPGQEINVRANHKNLNGFTVQIYKDEKKVTEQHYSLVPSANYQMEDTVFLMKAPDLGKYTMRVIPDKKVENQLPDEDFAVTRFKILSFRLSKEQYRLLTLDAETGYPIPHAKVRIYGDKEGETLLRELETDEKGEADFPWDNKYSYVKAVQGEDMEMPLNVFSGGFFRESDDSKSEQVILLTDRFVYRPGQTVYVKGIVYKLTRDEARVAPDRDCTVTLLDANHQEIGKKTLRTNDFGSFTTDFTLPASCLNGTFVLQAPGETKIFRVEEYKRPTFEVALDKQTKAYRVGDSVTVTGKAEAYSGMPMAGMTVKYTVKRSAYRFIRFWGEQFAHEEIASGEAKTSDDGTFAFPLLLEAMEDEKYNEHISYCYQIETTVTNAAGETQTGTCSIIAGNYSLTIRTDLKEKVCRDDSLKLTFQAENLSGEAVEAEGVYRLFRALDEEGKKLEEEPSVTGTFVANKPVMADWRHLPSGVYVWKATVKREDKKEETGEGKVILYSASDERPPLKSSIWIPEYSMEFDAEHPAKLRIGTSEKEAYMMLNVFTKDRLLESKSLILSDTLVCLEYPYKESYGDGILLKICLVKNGVVYEEQITVVKSVPKKKLLMKWETFRDRLRPGQQEEWKLTVKSLEGGFPASEVLATMYDASLDKIWKGKHFFSVYYDRNLPYIYMMSSGLPDNYYNFRWKVEQDDKNVGLLWYDYFDRPERRGIMEALSGNVGGIFARNSAGSGEFWIRGVPSTAAKANRLAGALVGGTGTLKMAQDAVFEEETVATADGAAAETVEAGGQKGQVRTNLSETAFFYPQLRTNERGEVVFSFTVPEALTRWNFYGYAHAKDMTLGTLEGQTVTHKEFMLTPNLPRFVRVGDRTAVAASIANATEKAQAGWVTMTLFDPVTEEVVDTQKQKFSVEAGQTVGVSFQFTADDRCELLGCRMLAEGEAFSDGEQQLLPVLSDKERLIETVPMVVRGDETRTFALDNLFNHHDKKAVDRKLTIEFTGNPAWYAVQALPSVEQPSTSDAIAWATSYYVNELASYILNSQPRIKAVFDSWKAQGGTKETFLSNLKKNQELKTLLLAESPWVLEAQTEEQRKERIATLFDLNNIRSHTSTALARLRELQGADGRWAWYKGMPGSSYVTEYIVELNARLALLTGQKPEGVAYTMQYKAFESLHKDVAAAYELEKKEADEKQSAISHRMLNYLYLIALSGEKVPERMSEAYNYYLAKVNAEQLASSSIQTKAMAIVILCKAGRAAEAQPLVASVKEHLAKTDEEGMYFAFNEHPYTWGNSSIETHIRVMEALVMAGGNDETVEEMKIWLLRQKQTQQWNSPVSTVGAIYALLMTGSDLLANPNEVRITIGGNVLSAADTERKAEAGTGYIRQTFTDKKTVNAGKVKVEKQGSGMAWGAVYAEYEAPLRELHGQGNGLEVEKQLYVERVENNIAKLYPVTDTVRLKVGDKVVSRLIIRTDRTMDFVQLKDQCAACFEPMGTVSGYRWNHGLGYYVDIKDASTRFFFDRLGKGTYVLEYSYRVSRTGVYESGIAVLQCAYAPEYASHSTSATVKVEE